MIDLSMLVLVVPLLAGIVLGLVLRGRIRFSLSRLSFAVILVLIFCLGFGIGSNNALLSSFPSVGADAVVLVLLCVGFSVLFVALVRRRLRL